MKTTQREMHRYGRPTRHPDLVAGMTGLCVCLATALFAGPVFAQEFRFNAEPAVAFMVDESQSSRFSPGLYFALRPGLSLGRVVALQWSYAMLMSPAGEGYTEDGSAHFIEAGVRVRPFGTTRPAEEQLAGLYADFNLGYVLTGELDRFGFDAALGYNFQAGKWFGIGPVVRYGQIVQADDVPNTDPNDAQFVTAGLNFAFGPAHKAETALTCPPNQPCPTVQPCPECAKAEVYTGCPDYDRDGVCDADDECPTLIGPPATFGCPIEPCSGKPLRVLVQFDLNSYSLPPPKNDPQTMDPVLDAVAKAIAQEPKCRVCIVGHASEEGDHEHNEVLSVNRSKAVQNYMTARGLTLNRMPSTGFGDRCQLVPETTRPANRRVEFIRLDEGQSCPSDCPK